ncbi:MAG: HAD-IC family P-type ATPase [Stigonema ocellatum SAG 48.90 = DSM 106950]|nr:HAD-IC family P-type ATPase [Stigonema ocellatum SAG 48.90 = DSM 106950]
MTQIQGLSEQQVYSLRANGQGNNYKVKASRSYIEIFRQNVLTFMNSILFGIGFVLAILGRPGDSFVSVGVVLLNVIVGVVQQSRSKYVLDRITLLTSPKVTVIRSGAKQHINPSEVVLGDVLQAVPGDQIVVDGIVIGDGQMTCDESLLTGESDLIPKHPGDPVYSGSTVVSGSALYEAQKVGINCFANQLTASARAFRQVQTPIQQEINVVIRVLLLLTTYFWGLLVVVSILEHIPLVKSVQMAAVIGALMPNNLFFVITVTYSLGAVRMAHTGALVQQINAVESLSHVDVLCLDKTGTLTANHLTFNSVYPIGTEAASLKHLLGIYAASTSAGNRTSEALAVACSEQARPFKEEIPFDSARKWSAIVFEQSDIQGTYVLGAPEMLQSKMQLTKDVETQISEWTHCGLRVLLFAYHPQPTSLHNDNGQPQLPTHLIPLGLISFADELRPKALETLYSFMKAGVRLKIISGDNPQTVKALVIQAGLDPNLTVVSGPELAAMDAVQFVHAAETATIFGRVTPQQKAQLVKALRSLGHYVAMIGDGVNDVMSLKEAQLAIAMESGSAAARGVADMVLLKDSFSALLPAVEEGQRIVNGIRSILKLFLTRIIYLALLIDSVGVVNIDFPFEPKNNSLLAFLTVGIPPFAMAAWARPGRASSGVIRSILHFVLPSGLTLFLVAIAVYVGYLFKSNNQMIAQSALTNVAVLCGLLLIVFVEPPTKALVRGTPSSGDWRPTILAVFMLGVYVTIIAIPRLRRFFELVLLDKSDYILIGGIVILWGFFLRFIWRYRLLERFLSVDFTEK